MLWVQKKSREKEWGVVADEAQMQVVRIGLAEKLIFGQRLEGDKGEL